MSGFKTPSAKWGTKKEWGAKVFKTAHNNIEMDADETGSSESISKKPYQRKWGSNQSFQSSGNESEMNSEEEDKAALYDIIHNMVDRILEEKEQRIVDEPHRKKFKSED